MLWDTISWVLQGTLPQVLPRVLQGVQWGMQWGMLPWVLYRALPRVLYPPLHRALGVPSEFRLVLSLSEVLRFIVELAPGDVGNCVT
jgi:hypothetical protein